MRNRIGARKKKASSGSSMLRNGSLTGFSKKEIGVRHRARGDREIEEDEQIGEPQAAADRRRVVDRLLDRFRSSAFSANPAGRASRRRGRLGLGRRRRGAAFDRRGLAGVGRRTPLRRRRRFQSHGLLPQDRSSRRAPGRLFSTSIPRVFKRTDASRRFSNFRQFLSENRNPKYHRIRMTESTKAMFMRKRRASAVRTCTHIGPKGLVAQKNFI